jgi:hypothetical protein
MEGTSGADDLGTGCGAVELVENRLLRKSLPYGMGP